MKNKTFYFGYENLVTGRHTFTQFKGDINDLIEKVSTYEFKYSLGEAITDLIESMEKNKGMLDQESQYHLVITMIRSYNESNIKFGNEDFYLLRTNMERFHTIGKKLWKGVTKSEAEKFFKKNLQKDYDSLYQNW